MKRNILFMLIGSFLTICIGISAYALNASEITYKDNKSVSSALDSLYEQVLKEIDFDDALYNQNLGNAAGNRSSSLTLTKGKYIVLSVFNLGSGINSPKTGSSDTTNILDCTSCTKTKISGKYYEVTPSSQTYTNFYAYGVLRTTLYYVEVTDEEDTISTYWNGLSDNTYIGEIVALQAIPIK